MSIERPSFSAQSKEKKSPESKFEFDPSIVPEEWIKDITEAQKEAYRIKVLAESYKYIAEKVHGEERGKEPSKEDYDFAHQDYEHLLGPVEKPTKDMTADSMGGRAAMYVFDTMRNAYLDWRARKFAKEDREQGKI